jgi:hypothetical protein
MLFFMQTIFYNFIFFFLNTKRDASHRQGDLKHLMLIKIIISLITIFVN